MPRPLSLILYQQQNDGQFVDVTTEAGITTPFLSGTISHRGGISAGDINNDGFLDLVFGMWRGIQVRLLINNGDGTFHDFGHRDQSGLDAGASLRRYYQHVFHDFNDDGYLDIFTAADGQANGLRINQQNNTFVDIARDANVERAGQLFWNEMGATLGDYDNDGDFDIFATNIQDQFSRDYRHHVLFRNLSVGTNVLFEEVAEASGLTSEAEEDRQVGWGTTFFDADNDGLLDLPVTNGMVSHEFPWATEDRSKFFYNVGGDPPVFSEIGNEVGFNDTLYGSSLVAFDYDLDGRLDMAQTIQSTEAANGEYSRIRLLHNEPDPLEPSHNFLVIRPRIPGPNHYAIGAVIRVNIGDLTLSRLITAGTSFMGQEPAEAHFGLGNAVTVDDVSVQWPDGEISHFDIDTVNQVYIVDKTTVSLPNPVITLLGADTLTVECDTEFVDPGATAHDDADGDITDSIIFGYDQLDTSTPGDYVVTYNVTDRAGFQSTTLTRTVTVQDTTPPELFLEGSAIVAITRNASYTDLGATATDECEGDLTENILTEGLPIVTATLGEFTVTYNVADSKENDATPIQRTVVISAGNFPIITLTGGNMNLECGQPFFDPGATASDTEDGDITQSIATGGDTVNIALPGEYTISYNVSDASNNQAIPLTRQVTVQDTTPPTITLENDYVVLACNENFTDPGADATDNCGEILAESILLSGDTVDDTSRQRVFRITYTVTDSAALTAAITRIVTVDCLPEDPTLQQIAVTLADNQPEFDGDSDNFLDLAEATIAIPFLTSLQFNDLDTNQDGLVDMDELSKAARPKILGCYAAPSDHSETTNLGDFILALLLLLALLHPAAIAKPNNNRP